MNEELLINLRHRWIESLFELAHPKFQKRLWLNADYDNLIGSFNECVTLYFDDLHLDNGYAEWITDGIITKTEFELISDLHTKFEVYVEEKIKKQDLSDQDILEDIEWITITNIALKSWNSLKEHLVGTSDQEKMMVLENEYLK